MRAWLLPPEADDEFERIAYYSLHYSFQVMFVLIFLIIIPPKTIIHLIIAPAILVTIMVCYILLHQRRLRASGMLFLASVWIFTTVTVVILNGLYNFAALFYVLVVVYSHVVFNDRRHVFVIMMLSIGVVVLTAIGQSFDLVPLYNAPPILGDRVVVLSVVIGSTGILITYISRVLETHNQELKTLTQELRVSEERYRLLFDNTSVMASIYDQDGYILFSNRAVSDFHNRSRSDLHHLHISELLTPADTERVLQQHKEALSTGKPTIIEGSTHLPTGKAIDYLRHVIPLPQSESTPEAQLLVLTTNLTDQRQAQKRQQELNAAQEKIQFFTEFFGTVSHDIKTPLAIMQTSLYLLERAKDETRRKEKIDQIREQVTVLEQYIQDMLMISRLDHVPTLNLKSLDVNILIDHIRQVLQPRIEQKHIHWQFEHQQEPLMIEVDEEQMRRVLMNLVENAINYTPDGGEVSVTATQQVDAIVVEVKDSGIGIPAEDIPHIFEPFYRAADAKKTIASGTGLGLAIVKKVIDLHHGSITVNSQPQQGSSFLIRLPLHLRI